MKIQIISLIELVSVEKEELTMKTKDQNLPPKLTLFDTDLFKRFADAAGQKIEIQADSTWITLVQCDSAKIVIRLPIDEELDSLQEKIRKILKAYENSDIAILHIGESYILMRRFFNQRDYWREMIYVETKR